MAQPSDLVAHYSSKIFQTRLYALTLIGALLSVSLEWAQGAEDFNFLGLVLILMVTSLGEANRRYTHSYLSACRASSHREGGDDASFWDSFMTMNEEPWSGKAWNKCLARFMLYWSTYIPGLAAGLYLILRESGPLVTGWIGIVISFYAIHWWIYVTFTWQRPRRGGKEATSIAEPAQGSTSARVATGDLTVGRAGPTTAV